jgi:hypothetical protein
MIKNFKIFEANVDNYEFLASNYSYHSWNDSYGSVEAKIYLDKSNYSLYLDINKTSGNSGINKYNMTSNVEKYTPIGNTTKPNLGLIKKLLSKYAYKGSRADSNFSKFWVDDEGNKMVLSDLIELHKPKKIETTQIEHKEKQKKELIHIKSIDTFDNEIELVKYSEFSYALFGKGTIKIKDQLNILGCKYNKFLTDPKTG